MAYIHDKSDPNWFRPKTTNTGWHVSLKSSVRRARMLKAHGYDPVAAGRACNALGNVSKDKATIRAARADAHYFFKQNERQGRILKSID